VGGMSGLHRHACINLDGVDGPRSPASMCHNVVVGERHN